MFMYAFARMLQEKTGQQLCLDYSDFGDYQKHHNASFENTLNNFNIQKCKVIYNRDEFLNLTGEQGKEYYKIKKKLDVAIRVLRIPGRHFLEERCQFEWNKKGLFFVRDGYIDVYPEVVETENIIVSGYWQSEKYFFPIREKVKRELKVITQINSSNKAILKEICEFESVCVHIRRGDYVRNGKTHCSDDYYLKGVDLLLRRKPEAVFFVFSDDMNYVKNTMSFPKKTRFIDLNNPGYEDLRLMYHCKNYILSNSSLSWWAQYLSLSNDDKIVVAPKPWFEKIPTDLNQREWNYIGVL